MKFRLWLETNEPNRAVLNDLMRRLSSGGLLGRDVLISAEEVVELRKVLDTSHNLLKSMLRQNPQLNQWFQEYQQWENTYGNKLIRLSFPNNVVQNGGNIPAVQSTERNITVPQELYNLLIWQQVGKSLQTSIQQIGDSGITGKDHPSYGISSKPLKEALWKFAHLLKK